MPSNYPTGLDAFTTGTLTGVVSGSDHGNKGDALNKIEAELGISPSSGQATVAARLASLGVNVKDHGALGDGTTDDTTAIAAAVTAAASVSGFVFMPAGTYKTTAVINLPSGMSIVGCGYRTVMLNTAAASTSFAFFQNTGFASSTAANDITIAGIRFRRETVLAGDEASYSNHINLRRVTNAVVKGCIFEGNEGGVHMEACIRFKMVDCFGYRQSDVSFRINWSGVDGAGAPPAQLGLVEGCWAADNGYQLGDGSAVPVPGVPIGTAFLCTQSGVTFRNCGSVDPKSNSFETGDGLTGLTLDGFTACIYTASRSARVSINNCADVMIGGVRQEVRAAGGDAQIYVVGAVGTAQANVKISDCTGKNYVTEGVEKVGINISDRSTFVQVSDCVYDGMKIQVGGTSTADVTIEDCEVRNCERHGYYFQTIPRITARNLRAVNNGVNTGTWEAAAEQRAGMVLDTVGADSFFSDMRSFDTRAGGARTQPYGWYIHASTVAWERNIARNNATAELTTTGTVVTYPLPRTLPTVAAVATLTLPPTSAEVVKVSGATTVTSIVATGWTGRRVTLVWDTGATFDVTDGSNLKLASSITAHDADDTLTLVCDGTNWFETGRSVN